MSAENFRVIARAIILTPNRRIVLVTSRQGNALVPPGGAVDRGELLPQAAAREAREECGLDVQVGRAIWLREFYNRRRARANLEVYFLAEPAPAVALPDRWTQPDLDRPDLIRSAGLYSQADLKSVALPVYPTALREAFWARLAEGFGDAYLGRVESED
ncbi:MAG TPA: NUDIX hydrolase [Anaerolineae bacterium]|nr:NUDIX hydrolase [Anaerolineae bacterium]